jgi:hypothetical protein
MAAPLPGAAIRRWRRHFLVPLAGLHGKPRDAWLKVLELWTAASPRRGPGRALLLESR